MKAVLGSVSDFIEASKLHISYTRAFRRAVANTYTEVTRGDPK